MSMKEVGNTDVAQLRTSGAFDADWYSSEYPDVRLLGMDPAEHYLRFGKMLGRRPSPGGGTRASVTSDSFSPTHVSSSRDPFEYFLAPSEEVGSTNGCQISRLMHYIWKIRPDLQAAFNLDTSEGISGFCAWFVESSEREYGFHPGLQSPAVLNNLAERDDAVGATARHMITARRANVLAPARTFEAGGVNLIGYAKGELGMGGQVRSAAGSLKCAGLPFDVLNVAADNSSNGDVSIDGWISQRQRFHTNIFHINADMFPLECLRYGRGHYNIGHWAWELPHCPAEFGTALELVDEIWAVSEFTASAFRERSKVPVFCMPQSIDVPTLSPAMYSKRRYDLRDDKFTFLFTFDAASLIDRKNPIDVVRAFKRAFPRGDEKVHLVVKSMNGERGGRLWRNLLDELRDSPRVTLIDSRFTQVEALGLTLACDAFISLHRSEGFGRCVAEAMAFGKPVIATNFSGSCDFVNDMTACPVDYELIAVPSDSYPFARGQTWAQPDVEHAAWAMKRLVQDEAFRTQKGKSGQKFVRDNFNDAVIGRRYAKRLEAIRDTPFGGSRRAAPSTPGKNELPTRGRKTVLFTITSKNYLSYARTVLKSVAAQHPEYGLFLGLADESDGVDFGAEPFTTVTAGELGIESFFDMTLRYDVLEFNTAIKPFMFRWLLDNTDADNIIYFDPDLFLYRRLDDMTAHLDGGASAVLTPHITEPLPTDGCSPDDHVILKSGVFNLGFIAIRRCEEARRFIGWWGRKLQTACEADLSKNLFTDQRWCDYAPCFLPNLKVLHDPGYNVAYWNLAQRQIKKTSDGSYTANGRPLVFFHFSGINPTKIKAVSKHQDRFKWEDLSRDCAELFDVYGKTLLGNGWEAMLKHPYTYDRLNDLEIRPIMRRLYRALNPESRVFSDAAQAKSYLLEICSRPVDRLGGSAGARVTELMLHIYRLRADLQEVFSLHSSEGRERFRDWFQCSGPSEYQLPPEVVRAA